MRIKTQADCEVIVYTIGMDTVLFIRTLSTRQPTINERLQGVCRYAQDHGWRIQTADRPTQAQIKRLIALWHPCGIIVESGSRKNIYPPRLFGSLPFVYLDRDSETAANCHCVEHDPVQTAETAAKELLSLECATYAYIPCFDNVSWSVNRGKAFQEVMRLHGRQIRVLRYAAKADEVSCQPQLRQFIRDLRKPCGIFAVNDHMGYEVLSACAAEGVSVPDEVAVVAVDNQEIFCENAVPPLSSVALDFYGSGVASAELLDKIIHGQTTCGECRRFGVTGLVRRASSRRLRVVDAPVSAALETIRLHACERLSSVDVLRSFDCSRRQAEMRFKKATGNSILEEIHRIRFVRACELLRTTRTSVEAVANMCGYTHAVFLVKLFRRFTGQSPDEWRRQDRTGTCEG